MNRDPIERVTHVSGWAGTYLLSSIEVELMFEFWALILGRKNLRLLLNNAFAMIHHTYHMRPWVEYCISQILLVKPSKTASDSTSTASSMGFMQSVVLHFTNASCLPDPCATSGDHGPRYGVLVLAWRRVRTSRLFVLPCLSAVSRPIWN